MRHVLFLFAVTLCACASSGSDTATSSPTTTPSATTPAADGALFASQTPIDSVAVHEDHVLFALAGDAALYELPTEEGFTPVQLGEPPELGANVGYVARHVLAAADGYVYWVVDGKRPDGQVVRTFGRTPLGGGTTGELPDFAPDDADVDAAHRASFTIAGGGLWFYRAPRGGADVLSRYDLVEHTTRDVATFRSEYAWSSRDLFAVGESVVFTDYQVLGITTASGSRANVSTTLVDGTAQRPYLAAGDEKYVYWAGVAGGTTSVLRAEIPKPGTGTNLSGQRTLLYTAAEGTRVDDLAIDATSLYVLERAGAHTRVLAVPVGGGAERVLFEGPGDGNADAPAKLLRTTHGLVFVGEKTIRYVVRP